MHLRTSFALTCILLAGPAFAGEEGPVPEAREGDLQARIERLVVQLGSEIWTERETATRELIRIGAPAVPALKKAAGSDDWEVKVRSTMILNRIKRAVRFRNKLSVAELRKALEGLVVKEKAPRKKAWLTVASASNLGDLAGNPQVSEIAEIKVLLEEVFERGIEGWEKSGGGRGDRFIDWFDDAGYIRWERTNSSADGGRVALIKVLEADVGACDCIIYGGRFRVDHHSLSNSGWWSDQRGGHGEYPVHIQLDYLDGHEKGFLWTHGLLTTRNSCRRKNYTQVNKGEWTWFATDMKAPQTLAAPDPQRPQEALEPPAILKRVIISGNGWDFAGAASEVRLVKITFKDERLKKKLKEARGGRFAKIPNLKSQNSKRR